MAPASNLELFSALFGGAQEFQEEVLGLGGGDDGHDQEPVREMPVASAARPKRERERRKTARRRSRATPHKRSFEHSARSERIDGAQQGITRTAS